MPYRTTPEEPTFQSLTERDAQCAHCIPDGRPFPVALDPFQATRYEIAAFGREAFAANIRYLGVCCGAGPHHIRALAEALGRRPPASRFSPDMSKHYALGTDPRLKPEIENRNAFSKPPRCSTGSSRRCGRRAHRDPAETALRGQPHQTPSPCALRVQ